VTETVDFGISEYRITAAEMKIILLWAITGSKTLKKLKTESILH
jgi:hypothetical protein